MALPEPSATGSSWGRVNELDSGSEADPDANSGGDQGAGHLEQLHGPRHRRWRHG